MSETTHELISDDERVGEILQAWLGRRELGTAEPAETLISQHPNDASRLRECIDSIEMLDQSGFHEVVWAPSYPTIPDFEIVGELGRGGMGIVYEARQISLDRMVALKILPMTSIDPMAAQRFQREAETAAALHHTNIVPIHAVGHSDGVHWYAMQRIEGRPLGALLEKQPKGIDPDEVARIGIEAADALALAHHHGVVHRDIKPANLLIQDDGQVWLTDFGLARRDVDDAATMTGAMLGTPRYMSPEQVFASRGLSLDHRSDIYSLGATLYELVTGTALFDGPTPLDVLHQIRSSEPAKPRDLRSAIPRDLEIVLQKCLAKDPKERYQSANDLASDLRAIREARPIKARGVPAWVRLGRQLKQHKSRLKLAGMAVAATLAVIMFARLWFTFQEHRQGGQLLIGSVNGPYVATIHPVESNGSTGPAIKTVAVPMQTAIRLEAGDYEVSLSSHALPSKLTRLAVAVGESTTCRHIDRRKVNEGISFGENQIAIVRDLDGADLLAALNGERLSVYGRNEQKLADVDLAKIDTEADATEFGFLATDTYSGHRSALNPYYCKPRRLMARAMDANGDGQGDYVLTSRKSPRLAAIDHHGETIWSTRVALPELLKPPKQRARALLPSVIDVVPIHDLDADNIDDLVVTLIRATDFSQVESFIATVSGKSGETISLTTLPIEKPDNNQPIRAWPREGLLIHRHGNRNAREVGPVNQYARRFYRPSMKSDKTVTLNGPGFFGFNLPVPPPLHLTTYQGRSVAVRVTDRTIDAWDLMTGKQVGKTSELPFPLAARPVEIRTGDTETPTFLIWSERNAANPTSQAMAVIGLGDDSVRWKKDVALHWNLYAFQLERCDFPLVADLDADGVDEILLSENGVDNWRDSGMLNCYAADTGERKWKRGQRIDSLERLVERGAVLRDFDNDGVRDVAIATIMGRRDYMGMPEVASPAGTQRFHVFVDLFSGKSGQKLQTRQAPFDAPHESKFVLEIDRLCSDGVSQLEVSVVSGEYEPDEYEATTLRFDLLENRPAEVIRGVSRVGSSDSDLNAGYFERRSGADNYFDHRFLWIEREEQEPQYRIDANRVLAQWVNPEGRGRILLRHQQNSRVHAVDVPSGKTLWTRTGETGDIRVVPVEEEGESSRVANHLVFQVFQSGKAKPTLVDAETGRVRWTIEQELGQIEKAVRNRDAGHDRVLIYGHTSFRNGNAFKRGLQLIQVSPDSGEITWKVVTLRSLYPPSLHRAPRLALYQYDCNRDGVTDTLVADDRDSDRMALVAFSGVDGSELWSSPLDYPTESWPTQTNWPMLKICGNEKTPRAVVFDLLERGPYVLRMLSLNNGREVDQQSIGRGLGRHRLSMPDQRSGNFEMHTVETSSEWPTFVVRCPANRGKFRMWTASTSVDGFGLGTDDDQTFPTTLGEDRLLVDVDQSGITNLITLHDNELTCFADDGKTVLWKASQPWQQIRKVVSRSGSSPLAYVRGSGDFDAVLDLADGKVLWDRSGRMAEYNQPYDVTTPIFQSSPAGDVLISATKEDVMWRSLRSIEGEVSEPEVDFSDTLVFSDSRLTEHLPTSPLSNGISFTTFVTELLISLLVSLVAVALPLAYLYRLIRKSFTLSYLLLAPLVTVPAIFMWQSLYDPSVNLTNTPSTTAIEMVLGGSIIFLMLYFLYYLMNNGHVWILCAIACCSLGLTALLVGVPLAYQYFAGSVSYLWSWQDVVCILLLCSVWVLVLGSPLWLGLSYAMRRVARTNMEIAQLQEAST